jgi:hypothetical protein
VRETCTVCGESVDTGAFHLVRQDWKGTGGIEIPTVSVESASSLAYLCSSGCVERIRHVLSAAGIELHPGDL